MFQPLLLIINPWWLRINDHDFHLIISMVKRWDLWSIHHVPWCWNTYQHLPQKWPSLVGGLEHEFYFSIYWESSSQLTFIFFRGVETTNQDIYIYIWHFQWGNDDKPMDFGVLCCFGDKPISDHKSTGTTWNWRAPKNIDGVVSKMEFPNNGGTPKLSILIYIYI